LDGISQKQAVTLHLSKLDEKSTHIAKPSDL